MLSRSGVIYFYKDIPPIQPQNDEEVVDVTKESQRPETSVIVSEGSKSKEVSIIPDTSVPTEPTTDNSQPTTIPPVSTEEVVQYLYGLKKDQDVSEPINSLPEIETIPEPAPAVVVPTPQAQTVHEVLPVTPKSSRFKVPTRRAVGFLLLIASVAGIVFPLIPQARLETSYASQQLERKVDMMVQPTVSMPPSVPLTFSPLVGPDGKEIVPINTEFSIIVPKIGINANIVASVDPLNAKDYTAALQKGVAHSKTSYFPDQDGAVYLFSHSTNYEWFVKDLNAIFYNLKNLEDGDYIVLYYKGKRYTYQYKSREVVSPKNTSYLLPVTGKKQLILQTCWPPGTTTNRLLIFADLVEEKGIEI